MFAPQPRVIFPPLSPRRRRWPATPPEREGRPARPFCSVRADRAQGGRSEGQRTTVHGSSSDGRGDAARPTGSNVSVVLLTGSPLSGTTWLQGMLPTHPEIASPVELHFFTGYVHASEQIWQR